MFGGQRFLRRHLFIADMFEQQTLGRLPRLDYVAVCAASGKTLGRGEIEFALRRFAGMAFETLIAEQWSDFAHKRRHRLGRDDGRGEYEEDDRNNAGMVVQWDAGRCSAGWSYRTGLRRPREDLRLIQKSVLHSHFHAARIGQRRFPMCQSLCLTLFLVCLVPSALGDNRLQMPRQHPDVQVIEKYIGITPQRFGERNDELVDAVNRISPGHVRKNAIFDVMPTYIWSFIRVAERPSWLIFECDQVMSIPGSTRVRLTMVNDSGLVVSESEFDLGGACSENRHVSKRFLVSICPWSTFKRIPGLAIRIGSIMRSSMAGSI